LRGIPENLYRRALNAGQGHIFYWWSDLAEENRWALLRQTSHIDFDLLEGVGRRIINSETEDFSRLKPAECMDLEGDKRLMAKKIGEQAIQNGEVCSLILAGGQGSRLGYNSPKGTYPIGPVSGKSLFEWFAQKIQFISHKFEAPRQIPLLIMTSDTTDVDTKSFFQKNNFFDLREEAVYFIKQGLLPAIDFHGKLLMDSKYHICESPDGHGGVIKALGNSGLLDNMASQGIQYIFIHNVDNCLVKVCDPAFLGHHIDMGADFSLKGLPKRTVDETLGTIVEANGKIKIVEYSDTPGNIANLKNEKGQLVFENGSINTYLIRVDFVQRLYRDSSPLPIHCMQKKILVIDSTADVHDPQEPNGFKLETKLFDVLEYTDKTCVVKANRNEEFSPLKSNEGPESYTDVLRDLQALFFGWLERSGINIPKGKVERIEISPLFAIDLDTFRERVNAIGKASFIKLINQQIKEYGQIRL